MILESRTRSLARQPGYYEALRAEVRQRLAATIRVYRGRVFTGFGLDDRPLAPAARVTLHEIEREIRREHRRTSHDLFTIANPRPVAAEFAEARARHADQRRPNATSRSREVT